MDLILQDALANNVVIVERELLKMPQADIKTTHKFSPGLYERTINIPPWTVLTGAMHKRPYKVRLESGTIAVNTDNGARMITAPCEFEANAGMKRIGRVFDAPVIWTDIFDNPDDCRDIAMLEAREYEIPECGLGENRMKLAFNDRDDYALFLTQIGLNQDQMDEIVKNDSDLIDMPDGFDVELKDSDINGKGLFATRQFQCGELICPGRIDGKRTPAGRYINHSQNPNAEPIKFGDDINAIAIRNINLGDEILVDYRASMKVNFGIDVTEAS